MSEQQEHLDRVTARISRAVLKFCRERNTFHAQELRDFVAKEAGIIAPSSADRVLRQLRKEGLVDYRVTDRRASMYEVIHD